MLDCFFGYHQIFMKKSDEEKTSFTTPFGTYCYVRMPEGLRKAGCTFNRTISAVLDKQLDRNISAYVDDVVVRSKKHEDHISDLRETFANLRKHGLKRNPEKCLRGQKGKASWMHDHREGHRGKSSKDLSHQKNGTTFDQEGGTKVDRPSGFAKQIHFTVCRKVTPFLQGAEGHRKFSLGY